MNLYKLMGSFAVAASLVACTVEDSASASESEKVLKYERHLKKGKNASMDCYVYENGNMVTVTMYLDLLGHRQMTLDMTHEFGAVSTYKVNVEMEGLVLNEFDETCESVTSQVAGQGGTTVCAGTTVRGVVPLPSVNDAVAMRLDVSLAVDDGIDRCNRQYDTYRNNFRQYAGEWVFDKYDSTGAAQRAKSCDVNVSGDVLAMSVVYDDKSMMMQVSKYADGVYMVNEQYTGVGSSKLASVCSAYKMDPMNSDVVCGENTISYIVRPEASFEDIAVLLKSEQCPGLLSGDITFDDLWFD